MEALWGWRKERSSDLGQWLDTDHRKSRGLQVAGRVVVHFPLSLCGLSLPLTEPQFPPLHNKGLFSHLWPMAVVLGYF